MEKNLNPSHSVGSCFLADFLPRWSPASPSVASSALAIPLSFHVLKPLLLVILALDHNLQTFSEHYPTQKVRCCSWWKPHFTSLMSYYMCPGLFTHKSAGFCEQQDFSVSFPCSGTWWAPHTCCTVTEWVNEQSEWKNEWTSEWMYYKLCWPNILLHCSSVDTEISWRRQKLVSIASWTHVKSLLMPQFIY